MSLIKMTVEGIVIEQDSNTPLVLLRDTESEAQLSIWIGPIEALAIQRALDATPGQRPQTHELVANVFHQCEINLARVTINDVEDGTYYASLHLQCASGIHELDARPSDAITLALLNKSPILVSEKIIQKLSGSSA